MLTNKHPLPHFDERPAGVSIDTIVIHSMCAPEAGDPCSALECIDLLDRCKVAAHYLIGRGGEVYQTVEEEKRAWHAGVSRMPADGRENVNHFSLGIELVGPEGLKFTDAQYESLAALCGEICARHAIRYLVGHDHIAPGRKADPGPAFDWSRLRDALAKLTARPLQFP